MVPQGLIQSIIKRSTGKVAAAGLVLFLVFTAAVLPNQASQSEAYAGEVGSPDQSFLYGSADLYDMAEAYGPDGRQAYIRARFTFDLVWPLVYMGFLTTSLGWLSDKLFDPSSRWLNVVVLPLVGGFLDYFENIAAAVVMARYPDLSPILASAAPIFTVLKWTSIGLSFAALLGLLGWRVIGRLRREPEKQA
jgi:hypothetical protein